MSHNGASGLPVGGAGGPLRSPDRTGWRLSVEPVGDDVAWSLFRRRPAGEAELVGAGMISGLGDLKQRVEAAVPILRGGPHLEDSLWNVPLGRPEDEAELADLVGAWLLPEPLTTALLEEDGGEAAHTVTIASRGWLATVAWEAASLAPGGEVRLVERARLLSGLAPALTAGRPAAVDRIAGGMTGRPCALAIVDPGPLAAPPLPLYPGLLPDELELGLGDHERAADSELDGDTFGALLRSTLWFRLFYLGHIRAGAAEQPASAALVLAEQGRTEYFTARRWLAEPQSWPAPPRVALIGCGGSDSGPLEHSGLVVAAVNAGATLVTTTRWTLPLDRHPPQELGTTHLALAVAEAHRSADPVESLRRWQVGELRRWRSSGSTEHAPLLWGSLTSYVLPEPVAR